MEGGSKYGWKDEHNHYFDDLASFKYEPLVESCSIRLMRLHLKKSFYELQSKVGTSVRNHVVSPNTTRVRIHKILNPDELPFWPLEASLHEVLVDDVPPFETVSYVYGPPERYAIICNGQRLFVTRNCALALYHLACDSDESTNRGVWVDQVCINQSDPIEKGQQVALMASIYGSSARTVAWLGEADDSLKEIFDTYNKPMTAMLIGDENGLPFQQAGIATLFSNAWFGRGWIIQEALLSHNLQLICGNYVVAWSSMIDFYRESLVWHRWILPDRETVYRFHQLRRTISASDTRSISVRQALEFTLQTSVTDQRDRLYALCGICKPISALVGAPNYTIEASELYLRFMCAIVDQCGPNSAVSWQIIDIYANGLADSDELPSWAPDFSRGQQKCLTYPFVKNTEFARLDQITSLIGKLTREDSPSSSVSNRTLLCQCVDIGTVGDALWGRARDLHRDLLTNGQAVQQTVKDLYGYSIDGNGVHIQVNFGRPGDMMYRLVEDTPMDRATLLPFNDAPEWNRMGVFASTSQWLLLAPMIAGPGDKMVLFEGNVVSGQLSVVRKCEDERWKYVGTCFILGWKRQDRQKVLMEFGTCGIDLC